MAESDFTRLAAEIDKVNQKLKVLNAEMIQTTSRLQRGIGASPLQNTERNLGMLAEEERALERLAARYEKLAQAKNKLAAQQVGRISAGTPGAAARRESYDKEINSRLESVAPSNSTIFQNANAIAKRVLAEQQELIKVSRIQSDALKKYQASSAPTTALAGAVNVVPGGAPGGLNVQALSKFNESISKSQQKISNELSERAKLEEKIRREAVKTLNQAINANVKRDAAKLGFDPNRDLDKIYDRGTGIQRFKFSRTDESGIKHESDLYRNQSGKVTPGISNQFRTFGQGVVRDIGELTKWSIALAAVYGPIKKLQELTQVMIENQTKLAEATIVVNSSLADAGDIFDIAAASANRAGEEITGVIDAFTLAYRAAGGTSNEIERLAIATRLLNDSLLLSKLSSLDQAAAIDTLSAAIRQTGGDFSTTTQLLDSWVRVTKVANVDLTTLATGFAVLGDAAEAAGISGDELNGIIAAISESTESSGKEVANQARALVSGFQSDNARKELENLGIAVEDTTGQMRPFLEIMQEIYNLRTSGIIDDTQFSKLTLALGGGTRRQSVYTTFIENFDRVSEVADESAKASGDAEAALATQLETVQTALTRLNNAFEELAQTLGTEGGFLGIITDIVSGLTGIVKIFDGLISALGKATPALAAFIATSALLKYKGVGGIQQGIGGLLPRINESVLLDSGGTNQPLTKSQKAGNVGNYLLGSSGVGAGAFQGLALSAIPALLNATNEDDRFGKTKAGFDIAGGVAGGVIGSLTGVGPIIGATIGTAIAEAFVNSTIDRKTDIFGYGEDIGLVDPAIARNRDVEDAVADPKAALDKAEIELFKDVGFGSEAVGRFLTSYTEQTSAFVDDINKKLAEGDEKGAQRLLQTYTSRGQGTGLKEAGIDADLIKEAFASGKEIQYSPESAVYSQVSDGAKRAYDEALSNFTASQTSDQNITTPFSELISQNQEIYSALLAQIRTSSEKGLSQERLAGDLRGTQYTQQTSALQGFDVKALQYYTALGDVFIDMNRDVDNVNDAFKAFALITTKGSQESVSEITKIIAEIQRLINLLDDPDLNADAIKELGGEQAVRDQLKQLQGVGGALLTDTYTQARLSQTGIPKIQGDRDAPLTVKELGLVKKEATGLQDQFYQGFLEIPDEVYGSMKKQFDEWAQIVEDSGGVFYDTISEIDPQFFQQALEKLIEEGKIGSQGGGFGLGEFDVDRPTLENLAAQSIATGNRWAEENPGFETKQEDLLAITSDGIAKTIHADFRILAILLEKMVDQNQKQLDGQYNIPEGATFWVPLTAAYYRPQNEGTSLGDIDTSGLDTSATNLDAAAEALKAAAEMLAQGKITDDDAISQFKQAKRDEGLYTGNIAGATTRRIGGRSAETEAALQEYRLGEKTNYSGFKLPDSTESLQRSSLIPTVPTEMFTQTFDAIKSIIQSLQNTFSGGLTPQGTGEDAKPTLTAKLDFQVDSTTNLTVDGRVLASIITPYLASDLLRIEASQGTITKRYVI